MMPWFGRADEPSTPPGPDSTIFAKSVQPFFAKNCYTCHNSKLSSGGLNLEAYTSATTLSEARDASEKILKKLQAGEMPPKGMPRPDEAQVRLVTGWIEGEFGRADRLAKPDPKRVTARRLNRSEYNNTVRDLLGVDIQPADDFPVDDSAYGFDNIAQALSISPLLMEKYLAAAEKIARIAVFGPELKNLTMTFSQPLPRRMETTNLVLIKQPAYYSTSDYDVTGLSHPGSLHVTYRFPAEGEYLFRLGGAGFRPAGSEPGKVTFWLDGKLVQTFDVNEAEDPGFEYRPDHWDLRLKVTAGPHDLVAAFPKQYEGLPPIYGGLNPSTRPIPEQRSGLGLVPRELSPEQQKIPELVETRRLQMERAKQQAELPYLLQRAHAFPGMAITELKISGPYDYVKGPSQESLRKVYTCGHLDGHHEPACERKILSSLAYRGYRGPVKTAEVDQLVSIADDVRKRGGSFEEGISVAINTILASSRFLFRIEQNGDSQPSEATASTEQYVLASRLSYFLWSSMPDEELLRCAEQGTLRKPEVLNTQVRRMLADPKSSAFVENFAGQWLETRRLKTVQPDRERFPDFDDYLRWSMIKETELFFQYIMKEDRSILDFIDAPYTFLNERLARHYGIRDVNGTEFRKVDLTGTGRGGILTQASVLTATSYGNRTSVVLRGKWILENILNSPVPPPPPNVPSLDEDAVGASASLRQQMEQHRKNPVCASCHARMDPIGFSFENYDGVGSWRTMDGKFPIDASGVLPDGRKFEGAAELRSILRQSKDAFAEGLTEKLLLYALGRGVERSDRPAIKQIMAHLAADNYKFSSLVSGIVMSAPFSMPRAETGREN